MKAFLLVFDDGSDAVVDLQVLTDRLDEQARIYTLDGHVCFIKSDLEVADLTDRFLPLAGSRLFFVTEISEGDYAGRMVGTFWDFFRNSSAVATAA